MEELDREGGCKQGDEEPGQAAVAKSGVKVWDGRS